MHWTWMTCLKENLELWSKRTRNGYLPPPPADAKINAITSVSSRRWQQLYFLIVGRGGDDECLKRFPHVLKSPPDSHPADLAKKQYLLPLDWYGCEVHRLNRWYKSVLTDLNDCRVVTLLVKSKISFEEEIFRVVDCKTHFTHLIFFVINKFEYWPLECLCGRSQQNGGWLR